MTESHSYTLIINGYLEREFTTEFELKEYIIQEQKFWSWLNVDPAITQDFLYEIYNAVFRKQHESILYSSEVKNPGSKTYFLGSKSKTYITRESKEGVLIQDVKKHYGLVTAGFLLLYFIKNGNDIILTNEEINNAIQNPIYRRENSIAIYISLLNDNVAGIMPNTKDQRLEQALDGFSTKTETIIKSTLDQSAQIEKILKTAKDDIYLEAKNMQRSFKRRNRVYRDFAKKSKTAANGLLDEATQQLAAAKAAYHDQVDLDASVQYWETRRQSHSKFKVLWFFAIVISMTLTFSSIILYYSYGGAAGIAKYIHPQTTAINISPNLENSAASSTSPTTTETNQLKKQYIVNSELSIAIADLAAAAILIALFGVLIKITLRQFNTHSHFALDAEERITFTKTYLALLNEGKLKADEDRRVILESLFRSSQPGSLTEIPFTTPIELIVKSLSEKK